MSGELFLCATGPFTLQVLENYNKYNLKINKNIKKHLTEGLQGVS